MTRVTYSFPIHNSWGTYNARIEKDGPSSAFTTIHFGSHCSVGCRITIFITITTIITPSRPSRERCRSPTQSLANIPSPPSHMLPPRKKFRDAPAISSQQYTPAKATVNTPIPRLGLIPDDSPWAGLRSQIQYWRECEGAPNTFEINESSVAAAPHVLPVTSKTIKQNIPLLVARLSRHDGVIDQVYDYLEKISPEHVEEIEDDIKTLQARLRSTEDEVTTLRGRVIELLNSRDVDQLEMLKL
ncbi:hypothetical protein Tco_0525013 [Tanacetum coccineum]